VYSLVSKPKGLVVIGVNEACVIKDFMIQGGDFIKGDGENFTA
jgi:hypothetical protein